MNTLTRHQKTAVFSSYFGCFGPANEGITKFKIIGVDLYNVCTSSVEFNIDDYKLLLTPLSAITDEDAIEVEFCPPSNFSKYQKEILEIKRYPDGFNIDWRYVDTIADLNNDDGWSYIGNKTYFHNLTWQQRDYLISKGYAVPLFIAPNHPNNGKTAIELGIAIDKTTL